MKYIVFSDDIIREKYHIPHDVFIVVFVGFFINRKGPNRVADALKEINDDNLYAFFIGRDQDGEKLDFEYERTLFKGSVEHSKIADYLNMADVFVLPTLSEGCCNSIRVDPTSVDELANAIRLLYQEKEKRLLMGENSLKKASSLTIERRAQCILNFMEDCLVGDRNADVV